MAYLNKTIVLGNLTRDPELKVLPSGVKVANFSIATNRTWKDSEGQKKEEVEYHNIVVFGRQAETSAEFLKKGSQALVEGRLKTQSWDDQGSGKKMYRTEIMAEYVQFGSRNDTQANQEQVKAPVVQQEVKTRSVSEGVIEYPEENISLDQIPF